LAAEVRLDRSSLAKIETGARRVSALELARIADAVGARVEWFLRDAPDAIVSRRNLGEPGARSPLIDALVERIARHVEFVLAHDAQLTFPAAQSKPRPRSADDAERLAADARGVLGVDSDEPLLDLGGRLDSAGLLTFSIDLGPQAADGASILLGEGGVAVVNGHLLVGRRRLTAAHEFCHYLVADDYTIDWRVDGDSTNQREARIDRFARALLLPPNGLERAWQECRRNDDDLRTSAVKIASRFRVDMSTLARRLTDLNLTARADAEEVRRVRTSKADIVELDLLIHHELEAPALPRPYLEAVLRLYRAEIVSAARATDLLLDTWDEADLPEIRRLPESAIWKFVS
jgi:Zn-dependent peptidase ImmA (M78 family)/transcriptional regulator with XRE-family HTH domain